MPSLKSIVLRHDVDRRPQNSLNLAKIESKLGLKGVYNFRVVPESWFLYLKVSIRDKVNPEMNNELEEKGYRIHSTPIFAGA